MKMMHTIFLFWLLHSFGFLFGQDCISISEYPVQACVQKTDLHKGSLRSLKGTPAGSLNELFYNYFSGTTYAEYKQLFIASDWYGLTQDEFNTWRAFIQKADLKILGSLEINASGMELGIIKYTYIIDDELSYETFLAKKSGSQWRPVSVKEEQRLVSVTDIVKFTNLEYLSSLITTTRQNKSAGQSQGAISNGMIAPEKLMNIKDSLRAFSPQEFKQRYNSESEYLTNAKFKEDRLNDSKFIAYLTEMQLNSDQIEVVMKYITAQDYLHAAQKADDFSTVTYTFSPFVDKIREVYGRDRLRKWDQVNQKWD